MTDTSTTNEPVVLTRESLEAAHRMMREQPPPMLSQKLHVEVGDKERAMRAIGAIKSEATPMQILRGIEVFEFPSIPGDEVHLVDVGGKRKVFKI